MALCVCNLLNDDNCLHYHSRRNNVVIVFWTLSSFLSCWNPATLSSVGFEQIEQVKKLHYKRKPSLRYCPLRQFQGVCSVGVSDNKKKKIVQWEGGASSQLSWTLSGESNAGRRTKFAWFQMIRVLFNVTHFTELKHHRAIESNV